MIRIPFTRKKEIVDLHIKHPKWSVKTLQKLGSAKELKNKFILSKWKKEVTEGPKNREKQREINRIVYEEFARSSKECRIIRRSNL